MDEDPRALVVKSKKTIDSINGPICGWQWYKRSDTLNTFIHSTRARKVSRKHTFGLTSTREIKNMAWASLVLGVWSWYSLCRGLLACLFEWTWKYVLDAGSINIPFEICMDMVLLQISVRWRSSLGTPDSSASQTEITPIRPWGTRLMVGLKSHGLGSPKGTFWIPKREFLWVLLLPISSASGF